MLYSDSLSQFPDYLVVVRNSKTGEEVKGLIDNEDLSYSMGANLGGGSAVAKGVEGAIQGAGGALIGKVAGDVGKNLFKENFKTVLSTYKGYQDSQDTPFSISMHLFRNKLQNGTYSTMINHIAKLTQAETGIAGNLQSYLYNPKDTISLSGPSDAYEGQLIHITIGNWFFSTGLFCSGGTIKLSKFVDEFGKPLFMTWDSTFTPYKSLNADEVSRQFNC